MFNFRKLSFLAAGAALLGMGMLSAAPATAEAPIIDFTGGTPLSNVFGSDVTLGYIFAVLPGYTVQIGSLGVWDEGCDGLVSSHQVGLWDSSLSLIASTTVTNANGTFASTSTDGCWRAAPITPVTLTPGLYLLGAGYTANDTEIVRYVTNTPTNIPGIFIDPLSAGFLVGTGQGGILNPPTFPIAPNSFFGPVAITVPEPGTYALLGAAGLPLLGLLRRRRIRA